MHRLLVILGMVAAAASAAIPLAGQEAQPFAVYAVSSQPTLEQSQGGGLFVSFDLVQGYRVQGGVVQTTSSSQRDGLGCRMINPNPVDCLPERLEEQVTFRSFRLALLPSLNLSRELRLSPGIGVSINSLHARSTGESPGRLGNLFLPKTANIGGFLRMDLSWWPAERVPLGLTVGGSSHWVAFDGCITGTAFYAPFCGARQLTEMQAGLSYRLPH